MKHLFTKETDIVIVGAGPVGLMCAYLGQLCDLSVVIVDKSLEPLKVGRADALNARTLQLFEIINIFDDIYSLGKKCNTSSVWSHGKFLSRQSTWWDELEGCFHKHFLMLGQSFLERLMDEKVKKLGTSVKRGTVVENIQLEENKCLTKLSNGEIISSKYVVGADGSRSFVRDHFKIPFQITRPQIIWAVIDGIIDSDFPKVPEIIVFQSETSDVAWIPREENIDRFYVRMDTKIFKIEEAISKINQAMYPHTLSFKEIVWFSEFSVKESVAESFFINERIFLAGDACHIHSVNGGQGLNTGIADAFNLMWKLNMVINFNVPTSFMQTYESERKPVALSVVETSGKLVRSTKFSENKTHAEDYVKIVQEHAGNITGMGIRYGNNGLPGSRLYDFEVFEGSNKIRLYSLLKYNYFTLFLFGETKKNLNLPNFINVIQIFLNKQDKFYWTENLQYANQAILVRPDSYIASLSSLEEVDLIMNNIF